MASQAVDIDELLLTWEERQERGETVSVVDLAGDTPQIHPELERRARMLARFEKLRHPVDPAEQALAPLPSFAGYQTLAKVGEGGMGVVFAAQDPALKLKVAVKVFKPRTLAPVPEEWSRLTQRFVREVQTLAQMRHENIVRIYGAHLQQGAPFFTMEYVQGGSLRDRQQELTSAGAGRIVPLMAQVARAVEHAHAKEVLHRDLKPGNILLDEQGRALVSDFGLAKLLHVDLSPLGAPDREAATVEFQSAPGLTSPGSRPGTRAYMAPEQYDPGFGPVGKPTDVWALGVILFELFAGRRPFQGEGDVLVQKKICHDDAPLLRTLVPGIDRRIEKLVSACLRKDPRERPTAAAVAQALEWRRPARRWPWLAAALTSAAALAWLAVVFSWREPDPDENYNRAIAPILQKLERGEPVELITGKEVPAFKIRAGAGTTRVFPSDEEGVRFWSSSQAALVELLPSIPASAYHVTAELRHDQSLMRPYSACGVYVRGSHLDINGADRHILELLDIQDRSPPGQARFALTCFGNLEGGARPLRTVYLGSLHRYEAPGVQKPWRRILIRVNPLERIGYWTEPNGNLVPLGPVESNDTQDFFDDQRRKVLAGETPAFADLVETDPVQLEKKTFGIYVGSGYCTVRRLSIVPTPMKDSPTNR